jgi:hypothetical protein
MDKDGYGQFSCGHRNEIYWHRAHRFSWALVHGEIPEGMWVLHRCDNPPCVNPDHLFVGTHEDNMSDMVRKGRQAKGARNGKWKGGVSL